MSEKQYTVPKDIWDECIRIIRGYDRLHEEYEGLLHSSPPPPDGQPRSRCPGKAVECEAIERALLSIKLNAVDEAFSIIPVEYRQDIRDKIVKRTPYPDYTGRNTFSRWKARMIKYLAERLLLM